MANIFKQNLDVTQHPNRNNFDLTHKVHGTYKLGVLYPFLCKPVVPSDSFRIDTACGFQFMPMPFPTQSNMRVVFHYFYVRNKNIWENWENWLQGLEEHTPPFISQPVDFYRTGSLADYLDIPTTFVSRGSSARLYDPVTFGSFLGEGANIPINYARVYAGSIIVSSSPNISSSQKPLFLFGGLVNNLKLDYPSMIYNVLGDIGVDPELYNNITSAELVLIDSPSSLSNRVYSSDSSVRDAAIASSLPLGKTLYFDESSRSYSIRFSIVTNIAAQIRDFNDKISRLEGNGYLAIALTLSRQTEADVLFTGSRSSLNIPIADSFDVADLPSGVSMPYFDGNSSFSEDTIKISALPFRAYESIYRCYYANSVLQPLEIDGVKKFNRYNTNLGDGADSTIYHLFYRNWELDAYTSCLPSPQQGNAPLVGMNVLGQVTIQDPDTGAVTTAQTEIDGENVNLVVTSPIQSVEHARTLVNLTNAGFSIADLRQTNNLTRFLEQSIRSGYRYIDFIKGQFGNEPKYAELDMPEFLGGFSQRVDVNMISNTNGVGASGNESLGSYAGQARAFGGSEHGITRYFDDYGFIVGIMCIVPDAAYSQLLPKHYLYNNRLDYYFPLFSEIGLQPITYEEVAPVQSHYDFVSGDTSKLLTDTFGYQRPNHEYVWYPDSIHGQMRLSLKDTLINRVFAQRPELGNEFLVINPEETNNIFSVTEDDNDVVIGQIVVKITAKRPIPRIVIPGLGR